MTTGLQARILAPCQLLANFLPLWGWLGPAMRRRVWQIHSDNWQNQYNIVKLNKIKFKKIKQGILKDLETIKYLLWPKKKKKKNFLPKTYMSFKFKASCVLVLFFSHPPPALPTLQAPRQTHF